MTLNIHTVFLLREHILFLEEWVSYHLSLGFREIFLYDNSRSLGNADYNADGNKYHYDFKKITADISETELVRRFNNLLKKYAAHLHHIVWEPLNDKGEVTYGQHRAIRHFIRQSNGEDWTAFIDIDEFIYSRHNLPEYIAACESAGIGDITLLQKKFDDRFNNLGIPVSRITACVEGINTLSWGPKHIIQNKYFNSLEKEYWNVHLLPTTQCKCIIADSRDLRFNHYNFNEKQKKWMRAFYQSPVDHTLNGNCYDVYDAVRSSPARKTIWQKSAQPKRISKTDPR